MFKAKDKVVRMIQVRTLKTATIQIIESVKAGKVKLVDSELLYDANTGYEINPPLPGCHSELIVLES